MSYPNILDLWDSFSQYLPTHPEFRKWAGIFLISAALTRRVWIHVDPTMPLLYPNLWILLVGVPGSGKDMAVNRVSELLEDATETLDKGYQLYFGEQSLSAKGLVDSLASEEAEQVYKHVNGKGHEELVKFNSIIGCMPEIGTFISEYNTQLISILNELYNCKHHFRDRIRGGIRKGQRVEITNPHTSFFFGTQPETLMKIFPESAFKMGFFARTLIVFGDKTTREKLYDATRKSQQGVRSQLVKTLGQLTTLSGRVLVAPEVQEAINHFHLYDCDATRVQHSKFDDYNTRRSFHLQKLAIVLSIAESPAMRIEMRHWEQACNLLFETEKNMPSVFEDLITDSGFHTTVEQIITGKQGQTISQRELERKLRRRHRPLEIPAIMNSMLASRDLVKLERADHFGMPLYEISSRGEEMLDG